MAGTMEALQALSPVFEFWWIAAFVILVLILIVATVLSIFCGTGHHEPCS